MYISYCDTVSAVSSWLASVIVSGLQHLPVFLLAARVVATDFYILLTDGLFLHITM